jgi:hypothetical protein
MTQLASEINNKIIESIEKTVEALNNNELNDFELFAEKGWELLCTTKENWEQGYFFSKTVFNGAVKFEKAEIARIWLDRMVSINKNLHTNDDECLFYEAKFFFMTDEYVKALTNFREVIKSAGFSYFDNDDPKYLNFYQNPQKYMKK